MRQRHPNRPKEETDAIAHAVADNRAGRSWSCECAGCVAYRADCSPALMDVYVAFTKLEQLEDQLDELRLRTAGR